MRYEFIAAALFLFAILATVGLNAAEEEKPKPVQEPKPVSETKKAEAPAIEDETFIKATPERVFKALTEGAEIAKWWPKAAESDPKAGGKLTLIWMDGGRCETKFETFEPGKEVSYTFYAERLTFKLAAKGEGTELKIIHRCGPEAAIHVAQCWGFLKANLKSVIEFGNDLR